MDIPSHPADSAHPRGLDVPHTSFLRRELQKIYSSRVKLQNAGLNTKIFHMWRPEDRMTFTARKESRRWQTDTRGTATQHHDETWLLRQVVSAHRVFISSYNIPHTLPKDRGSTDLDFGSSIEVGVRVRKVSGNNKQGTWIKLNSKNYGLAQSRPRVYMIYYQASLGCLIKLESMWQQNHQCLRGPAEHNSTTNKSETNNPKKLKENEADKPGIF